MGVELSKNYVVRINLKTGYGDHPVNREDLINYCLRNKEHQYVAIGWSDWYNDENDFNSYQEFHEYVKKNKGKSRFNAAFGVFWDTTENDLFWTRDTSGIYWICRAKGPAEAGKKFYRKELDIGAVVPVEAYAFGTQVPGQIKASFNRANGGITQRIYDNDSNIVEYSKYVYNLCSGTNYYSVNPKEDKFLNNLPAFELEELVISYLQIEKGYYLLSNSIASKSTTVSVECELASRERPLKKAVVQVKAKKSDWTLYASNYKEYLDRGYYVYLYAPHVNIDITENKNKVIEITEDDLNDFVNKKGDLLPDNIMMWKDLFSTVPEGMAK